MNGIEITEISITICDNLSDDAPLIGWARITLNGLLVINGIRILNGRHGKFIAFPRDISKKEKKPFSIVYPINREFMERIKEIVLVEFDAAIAAGVPFRSNRGAA